MGFSNDVILIKYQAMYSQSNLPLYVHIHPNLALRLLPNLLPNLFSKVQSIRSTRSCGHCWTKTGILPTR